MALPTRSFLFHEASTVTAGNAISVTVDAAQAYGHYTAQSASANADAFTQSIYLRAGTYTVTWLGETTANSGMIDWLLDGVTSITTGQDWYSAATTRNVSKTATVTISTDGYHTIKGTVNGKNGSSGDYEIRLTAIWFKQASD
jgi:hypothetical protein